MAIFITSDTIGAATVADLGAVGRNFVHVAAGVLAASTGSFRALIGSGSEQHFSIAGTVMTMNTNTIYTNGDRSTVSVLVGGSVVNSALGDLASVNLGNASGFSATLVNAGTVLGGSGVFSDHAMTIINSGSLTSVGTAASSAAIMGWAGGASALVDVTNTGLISGVTWAIRFSGGRSVLDLDNAGTIRGGISLDQNADVIVNTGEIFGDLYMEGGADRVVNRGLIDGVVDLGAGDDVFVMRWGGEVLDMVDGGFGADRLGGGAERDVLLGGAGADLLLGRGDDDSLHGGDDNDIIRGGAGDDEIIGGAGADRLYGGRDADTFVFHAIGDMAAAGATDRIMDFNKIDDLIDLTDVSIAKFAFMGTGAFKGGGKASVSLAVNHGNTVVKLDVDGDGTMDGRFVVDHVTGLNAGDFLL